MRFGLITILVVFSVQLRSQQLVGPSAYLNASRLQSETIVHHSGKKAKLQLSSELLHVLVFISPECPLCINYSRSLKELAGEFKNKVKFIAIIPGKSYPLKAVRKFRKEYDLPFDFYVDDGKKISTLVHATVTPEVILFNNEGRIYYRGAIDDWVVSLGRKKQRPTKLYLHNAIQQSLLGQEISLKATEPKGCLINDY